MCGAIEAKNGGSYRIPGSIRQGWLSRRLANKGYTGVDVWYSKRDGLWWALMNERGTAMELGPNIKTARSAIDAMPTWNKELVAA